MGGDFYDLRFEGRRAVLTLGDVMGNGVGAAILAAEARTALRSVDLSSRPAEALADSARIIDDDLRRSDAFVTLGHASIDLVTGWGGAVPELIDAISTLRSDPATACPQLMADALCCSLPGAPTPDDEATAVILTRDQSRS